MDDSSTIFFQPELFPQTQPIPEAFQTQEAPNPVDLLADGFDVSPPKLLIHKKARQGRAILESTFTTRCQGRTSLRRGTILRATEPNQVD
mmetsp:Transcript_19533/g.30077  ORF Transcript_19533/g.30077 Transcript_19533/m.30077 type:complete len:90 (+) Transcript_19533:231-500(+)